MRLGIDIREIQANEHTGISRYLLNIIELASQKRDEYDLFLYGNQFSDTKYFPDICTTRIIPEGITFWWDQFKLRNQLKKDAIALFLSPYFKAPYFSSCPFIITIHDLMFLYISSKKIPWKWIYNIIFKFTARLFASKAKLIITDSQSSKSEIIKFLKIPEKKIEIIYLGVSPKFKPIKNNTYINKIKQRYGIKGKYIFYLGNFKPHKNISRLIEAYSMLQDKYKNTFYLVLAGKQDSHLAKLLDFARKLKVNKKLIYIGAPADKHLPSLYSGAKIFIMPSLAEGFGLPALEAMSCGTPVIVGNYGALPEVVGQAGILVDSKSSKEISQAISKLLNDSNLYNELVNNSLLKAQKFSSVRSAERIIELIENIISNT